MSAGDWRDQVPSRAESERRAADEREALRDRVLELLAGGFVVVLLALVVWSVYRIGGGWS